MSNISGRYPILVLGDFDVRLHTHLPQKDILVGTNIFDKGMDFLTKTINPPSFENKNIFIEFYINNYLMIDNTFFLNHPKSRYSSVRQGVRYGPPRALDRYVQFDIFLVPECWKHSILDIAACPEIYIDSDYYICSPNFIIIKKIIITRIKEVKVLDSDSR